MRTVRRIAYDLCARNEEARIQPFETVENSPSVVVPNVAYPIETRRLSALFAIVTRERLQNFN